MLPACWDGGGDRYDRRRDTSVTHSPGASGRIAFWGGDRPGENDLATFARTATTVPFRGGRVRYRGWLRTRDVRSGWAGLWLRVDGADREVLEFDNLGQVPPDRSLKGTNDWTQAEIVLPVAAEAVPLAFGVLLVGDGSCGPTTSASRPYRPDPARVPHRRLTGRVVTGSGSSSSWSSWLSPSAGSAPAPRPRPPRPIGRCHPQRSMPAAGADR